MLESDFTIWYKIAGDWFVTWLGVAYYARRAFLEFSKVLFIDFLFWQLTYRFWQESRDTFVES
jgi:hypothetical protein